jgi:hypothetical protein
LVLAFASLVVLNGGQRQARGPEESGLPESNPHDEFHASPNPKVFWFFFKKEHACLNIA